MHINFRDSKLTHILQPALSGNARMTIICCVTQSELLNTLISTLNNDNKYLKEKTIEYEKQINVIVFDVAESKSECDYNNKIIMNLTTEKVAAIGMNDKLSETEDAKVEEFDKLVMDNNTLEKGNQH